GGWLKLAQTKSQRQQPRSVGTPPDRRFQLPSLRILDIVSIYRQTDSCNRLYVITRNNVDSTSELDECCETVSSPRRRIVMKNMSLENCGRKIISYRRKSLHGLTFSGIVWRRGVLEVESLGCDEYGLDCLDRALSLFRI